MLPGASDHTARKGARRQHRVTISDDMGALWDWFKEVPPKAAAGEIEFLLRLGVLAATGVRCGGGQAGQRADRQPTSPVPAHPAAPQRRADAQLDSAPVGEGLESGVEQAAGWNFLGAGFEAAGAVG